MRIAMVYPTRESEKAISGYSKTLIENIRNSGVNIDDFTYSAGSPKSLFRKIKELKTYDVIHIQHEYNLLGNYGIPFFWLYFTLSFSNAKVVTTMHNVLSTNEKFNGSRAKTFLRKCLYFTQNRWIDWFSDVVVLHANFFKDILSNEYSVPKRKIRILPQGIIENVPKYNKNKIKKELGLSGPVYTFMGSMVPDHGHDIIVSQADKVGKTILIVANPGSVNDRNSDRTRKYLEENKEIVKKNKFDKFVRFDINEELTDKNHLWWKYFIASDLILLPYRGGIGSGIFAHAMAAGIPIIASDIQYFRELSKDFGVFKIAKNDEDYPNVIKDAMRPKEYARLVKECERYLNENGLSVIGKKYKKLYLSIK